MRLVPIKSVSTSETALTLYPYITLRVDQYIIARVDCDRSVRMLHYIITHLVVQCNVLSCEVIFSVCAKEHTLY